MKIWKRWVEAKGILVCQTSVNTHLSVELKTFRGFCIAQKPFPVIVLNPKDSPNGRIFTIIHELVHIGLGKSIIQNMNFEDVSFSMFDPVEVFCNQAAAEFLVPEKELLRISEWGKGSKGLAETCRYFRVSQEMIMRRLLTLEKISLRKYQMFRNEQQRKYKDAKQETKGFPHYHTRLLNTSGELFARSAFSAYYEDKITLAELTAVFSNCDTKHISKIESAIYA